ncbi:MAG: bi-domain-containing oxidoreductase [Acidimicrobiales bacterium]
MPQPIAGPTEVLVRTAASVVSSGTERAVTSLAQSSLLAKAKARPDLVRQVVTKARRDGIGATTRAVRSRLGGDLPLGYSAAGVVVKVGEHVSGIAVGQLVATGGAGKANHAELQAVPGLLCVALPQDVRAEDGAFATISAIALHGLRLAEVGPGSKVVVVGLGLVGQLALRLAMASGCDAAGIDVQDFAVERARTAGATAWTDAGAETTDAVLEWSRGRGADAVLIASSGHSSDVVRRVPALCRDRATVVVVGDVGLDLDRRSLYEKELSVRVARSYGPGRHERSYEEWGVDLPPGQVRWSEGRNLEAVVDLLASKRLKVADLVTHRFPIENAAEAYALIETRAEPYIGVQLTYGTGVVADRPVALRNVGRVQGEPGVGLIGAGAFASGVLLPALKEAGFTRFVAVASASGLSAKRLGERMGFERAVSGAETVYEDPDVDVVVIVTAHDSHAELATAALRAGKHVYCEKPLALTEEELADVSAAWQASGRVLFVGFNRRWSKAVRIAREHFEGGEGPLVLTYRASAGSISESHWYHDRRQGGRLIGEVCHFVDTCGAVVGSDPVDVRALASGNKSPLLEDNLVMTLRYQDGSTAAITYSSAGHHSTPKERLEVLGRGKSAVIDDFARVSLDGKVVRGHLDGKGHSRTATAFRRLLVTPDSVVTVSSLESSKAVIEAVTQITSTSVKEANLV